MKKIYTLMFTLLIGAGLLTGCNTMEGAGEDVEAGGQAVQDSAS